MFKFVLKNGIKINMWINESLTIIDSNHDGEIIYRQNTELKATSKKIIVELFIPRACSNYALLGLDFISTNEKKSNIKISIDEQECKIYKNSIALPFDKVNWGIMDEYKQGILNSIYKHINILPSGIINYNISAHGEIGSSIVAFEIVSDILLSLLQYNDINEKTGLQLLNNYFNVNI